MRQAIAGRNTERLFLDETVQAFGSFERQARGKLPLIEAASSLDDLRVPPGNWLEARLPLDLEHITNIKTSLVDLARHSHSRHVREDLLPDARSGRRHGTGYSRFLIEFINDTWDPRRAARNAPSLKRAITRLASLASSVPPR
jgi:plasmid maintenance system killer protein